MPTFVSPHPKVALMCEIDVREWNDATAVMWTRNGNNVTIPTTVSFYEDLYSMLNGRGSYQKTSLKEQCETFDGVAGTWGWSITSGDRVEITNNTAGAGGVIVIQGGGTATAAFGLVSGQTSSWDAARALHVLVATNAWTRGPVTGHIPLALGGALPFSVPAEGIGNPTSVTANDPLQMIRSRDVTADADDNHGTDCLEDLDQAAADVADPDRTIRWSLSANNRVVIMWDTTAAPGAFVFGSATASVKSFWHMLGFTRSETTAVSGTATYIEATYPPWHCWFPSRPIRRCQIRSSRESSSVSMPDGAVAASDVGGWTGWAAELYLDGPWSWNSTTSAYQDDELRILRKFLTLCPPGFRCTLYRHWGDPRRFLLPYSLNADQPAYDLLYTSETRRGRLRCVRDPDDDAERTIEYLAASGRPLDITAPITVLLRDRVD